MTQCNTAINHFNLIHVKLQLSFEATPAIDTHVELHCPARSLMNSDGGKNSLRRRNKMTPAQLNLESMCLSTVSTVRKLQGLIFPLQRMPHCLRSSSDPTCRYPCAHCVLSSHERTQVFDQKKKIMFQPFVSERGGVDQHSASTLCTVTAACM